VHQEKFDLIKRTKLINIPPSASVTIVGKFGRAPTVSCSIVLPCNCSPHAAQYIRSAYAGSPC